ncbi:37885_t:CDS:1, partial [Gigaspora margarita]
MTETKLPESTTPRSSLTNPLYTIFTANNNGSTGTIREASLGTAIAIHLSIQPYIHKIKQIPGYSLLIDFFFPPPKLVSSPLTSYLKPPHLQE